MVQEPNDSQVDDDLIDAARCAVRRRSMAVSAMAFTALALLAVAVTGIRSGSSSSRSLWLVIALVLAAAGLVSLVYVMAQQRTIDCAVSEVRRRGQTPLLTGLRLQRLDGSGLMPALEISTALMLLLVIGIAAWTVVLVTMDGEPSVTLFRIGAGLLVLLFLSIMRIAAMLMKAERRMRRRTD